MSVFSQVKNLPSFNSARDESIPRKTVGKVLEAARHAPSPGNVQSLEFIVVEDEGKKEMLFRATDDERVREAPTAIVLVSDIERMRRRTGEGAREFSFSESACAVQNMRLVAAENNLASAWVGGFNEDAVREKMGVPEGKTVTGIVLLSYTDNEVYGEDRFGMNEICFYDEYGNQIESFFETPGWRGIEEETRIFKKRSSSIWRAVRERIRQFL